MDKAKHELGNDIIRKLTGQMRGMDNKPSKVERDKSVQQFEQDLAVTRTLVATELPTGVDPTARVGRGIIRSLLTGSNWFAPPCLRRTTCLRKEVKLDKMSTTAVCNQMKITAGGQKQRHTIYRTLD